MSKIKNIPNKRALGRPRKLQGSERSRVSLYLSAYLNSRIERLLDRNKFNKNQFITNILEEGCNKLEE